MSTIDQIKQQWQAAGRDMHPATSFEEVLALVSASAKYPQGCSLLAWRAAATMTRVLRSTLGRAVGCQHVGGVAAGGVAVAFIPPTVLGLQELSWKLDLVEDGHFWPCGAA